MYEAQVSNLKGLIADQLRGKSTNVTPSSPSRKTISTTRGRAVKTKKVRGKWKKVLSSMNETSKLGAKKTTAMSSESSTKLAIMTCSDPDTHADLVSQLAQRDRYVDIISTSKI